MGAVWSRLLPGREGRFLALCLAAAVLCAALAVGFAVPLEGPSAAAGASVPLVQAAVVDLNTAGLQALCTLPGVGEKRAQAILDLRSQLGAFRQMSDLLVIPGITPRLLEQWEGQAVLDPAGPPALS